MKSAGPFLLLAMLTQASFAAEFHVTVGGNDSNPGSRKLPLRTIQRAADLAQPGDTITVHEGTYREQINPPRGGTVGAAAHRVSGGPWRRGGDQRIGSCQGWVAVQPDVWKVRLPNSFFGQFNPYTNAIHGDWFNGRGRQHHTGAVYLNGDWLTEAVTLEEVLMPSGTKPDWLTRGEQHYLLNLAWLRPGSSADSAARDSAASFAAQRTAFRTPRLEGGECIGWIEHGDWVTYEGVDFGAGTEALEFRAASAAAGGVIEIRLDTREGELLGICTVAATGDWQAWATFDAPIQPVSGMHDLCLVFKNRPETVLKDRGLNPQLWFAEVDEASTTLWAQFEGVNPNEELVEINARQICFLSRPTGAELHHGPRVYTSACRHAMGAADGRADRPDRHALEQGLDH
jgi:alpha-L-arabinofuranosidase